MRKDGYFYGRGTQDMKSADAILVTTFIRFQQEGYKPDRDIILALTADEEGGKSNGVDWLLKNHRDLIDAEFVLNPDGGGVDTDHGKPVLMELDGHREALRRLSARGHQSRRPQFPAHARQCDLSRGRCVNQVQAHHFPLELNDVTRAFFVETAKTQTGQVSADMTAITKTPPDQAAIDRLSQNPLFNSLLRTTCVATRFDAGHANNALPQRALANVNCRIFPGHSREEIRQQLVKLFDDPKLAVRYVSDDGNVTETAPAAGALPPVALRPDVVQPLQKVTAEMWPGIPVVPAMSTGASDGKYTNAAGLPTYGVSGIAIDLDDIRAHGRDERVGVASYYRGVDFYYRYLKALSSEQ